MFLFQQIRDIISKKRIPPQKKYKPTQQDLELLRLIRVNLEHDIPIIIQPPPKHIIEQRNYENAKTVKRSGGLSDIETLIKTGYWVGDETNG